MFDKKNIKIYDSLSNSVRPFKPIKENEISMYVCGPTVYNHNHIGNARPVIFFDMVKKYFEYVGYNVKMVMNFTDIDDKIIKKAIEENITETEVSEKYIEAFLSLCDSLNCDQDVVRPRVTKTMDEIVDFIDKLQEKEYAYQSGDDVFFRVKKVSDYGALSNQQLEELESGSRINVNDQKEDPRDFTLWKKTSDTGKKWESPFGAGRPGWHTECVVMIHKILGNLIDIHGGGNDLKFPHHENEIAQAMALCNNKIANYWLHNARVDLGGQKMSKSLGNIVLAKDVVSEYGAEATRLMILSNHYRQNINYSQELMTSSVTEWNKIKNTKNSLQRKLELFGIEKEGTLLPIMDDFLTELGNDFNTSNAFTLVYKLLKEINSSLRNPNVDINLLCDQYKTLSDMLSILGINTCLPMLTDKEKALVISWQNARKEKNFELADKLRKEITEAGIIL